jgi:hypothetical protein
MRLLRRCDHLLQAQHYANVLRAAGIACELRNAHAAGAFGELPFDQCMPQLWVVNRLDEGRARDLLESLQQPFAGKTWACECGERIEPQFAACWQCGAQAPEPQVRSGQPASE